MLLFDFYNEKGVNFLLPLLCSNFACKICEEQYSCKEIKSELTEFFQSELYGVEVNQVDAHTLFSVLCNAHSCKKCPAHKLCRHAKNTDLSIKPLIVK